MLPASMNSAAAPWTFRRCLWWCLPALIVAAALRLSFLVAIPEAYYGSDSNSYFSTTARLYTKGKFKIEEKRRWLYPLLLTAAPPLPGSVPQTVAVVQHLLGLAMIPGIGWVAGSVARFPGPTALATTLLAAIWPRMLWYEHEIVAEVWMLAAFVAAIALAFPLEKLGDRRRLLWFLIAAGLIAAIKPHGRPLWLGLTALAAFWHFRQFRWPHLTVIAATAALVFTSGSDRQGSWLLLSSTLPLVNVEGEKWKEYREALRPVVEQVRGDVATYPYIQNRYKKPLKRTYPTPEFGPVWAELNRDEEKFSIVAKGLALEGIRTHPFDYLHLVTRRILYVLADSTSTDDFPISRFWNQQERRSLEHREENPQQLPFLYEQSDAETDAMILERRQRTLWFEPFLPKVGELATWLSLKVVSGRSIPEPGWKWTGALALLGMFALAIRRKWRALLLLTAPTAAYIFVIFSVGDRVPRYLHPVDWIGLLFVVLAVDGAAAAVRRILPSEPRKDRSLATTSV